MLLRRKTLTSQVIDYAVGLIKSGSAKPGDRLPTETELTQTLGVSRTCVREAMKSLESMGLIEIRQRVGATVLQPSASNLLNAEQFSLAVLSQQSGDLLEYAQFVTGLYYGTPRTYVEEAISQGQDVLLEIDVKGAIQVKEGWQHGVYVFLLPPSMEELEARLKKRQTDAAEAIRQRLTVAVDELNFLPLYDYQLVNDDIDTAVGKLEAIIKAERCRVKRLLPQR